MSNVPPDGLEDLHQLLLKLSSAHRAFGLEVNFNGSSFTWTSKIHNLKADEVELNEPEKRVSQAAQSVPSAARMVHRKP